MLLTKDFKAGFSHLSALAVAPIIAGPAECLGVPPELLGRQQSLQQHAPFPSRESASAYVSVQGREKQNHKVFSKTTQIILLALALILKPGHMLPSLLQWDFSMCLRLSTYLSPFLG